MRRVLWLALFAALSFHAPCAAIAAELPLTGTLSLQILSDAYYAPFVVDGAGVAVATLDNESALVGIHLPPSIFATPARVLPVTDPSAFPILGFQATIANDAGTFASGPSGFGGTMPLQGSAKVCLFGACSSAIANVELPLSLVGRSTTVDLPGSAVNLTVSGAPWTTRSTELARVGWDPPQVIAGSRQSDSLNLVTPVFISTNIGASAVLTSYARLVAFFEPPAGGSCDNGLDDDGDGLVDFPDDPGCESADDPSERIEGAPCDDGLDNDGDRRVDAFDPGCDGPLDDSEQSPTLVCDDGLDNDGDGVADFPADPGCSAPDDDSEKGTRACDDGIDTDDDGFVDFPADPGCESPGDRSERGPDLPCDDGIDNDQDGVADFPGDSGCESIDDPSERSGLYVCDDDIDQDGDGRADFPDDPGCASATDASERSALLPCDDGLDNDFDGTRDHPGDLGCYSPSDPSELSASLPCDNGLDDDGDGLIDSQQDPGCSGPDDVRESADLLDGLAHQIDQANPSPDYSVYLGSDGGSIPTSLWVGPGGVIEGDLHVTDDSYAQVDSGALGGDLFVSGEAHVVVRGGTIGGHLDASGLAHVEIHGTDFDLPYGEVLASSGTITGFLLDGSAVSIEFSRAIGATIELVPEPAASAATLVALASLVALRARRSRRA